MSTLRRLARHRLALFGAAVILLFAVCAIFAPYIAPHDPYAFSLAKKLQPPSRLHLLGTDELGRDLLSRIIHGTRVSLLMALISVAIGLAVGVPVGALSGFYGGWFDLLVQRAVDILLAFPGILLAIVVVAILGPGLWNAMLAVGISFIPTYVRVVRGSVLELREKEFVEAARALGTHSLAIIRRHILPNCLAPIIVLSTLQLASAILWASGLGFLGLGAQPPTPEWGTMLGRSQLYIRVAPHVAIFPGLAIALAVLGFNLLGDGLRDALDPRLKGRL
ncbi:MAG: ABC transporter permease [Candidatus Bipolaricaulota bacterium]|nr:ABC transporter permease [Candidatus Bipolaricaulota bacterium]MCX7843809.1 ABC transporter permease [Candidatus Bipolaricaulota bacterium]MDW8151391.1 ABC transporter permease [Candidatus Bipolaricaulota bacterium]